MIDLTQPAPKIAEDIIKLFSGSFIIEGDSESDVDRAYQTTLKIYVRQAIKAVELALQVCPEEYLQSFHDPYFKENPDHTKLTEVLRILKEK